jgi:hypothetical protein
MLSTRLILIEGLPGSGKSTTAAYLASMLRQQGLDARAYLEEDDPHPIPWGDYPTRGLAEIVVPLWQTFTAGALLQPAVTILESRLWQNTTLFMYMCELSVEEILGFSRQVWPAIAPLAPVLIYLDQDDTEAAQRRLYTLRGEEWMKEALDSTLSYPWFRSRGLNDFAGWVQFFQEWSLVAEQLFADWPGQKIKVLNPHEDWPRAYRQMQAFLVK